MHSCSGVRSAKALPEEFKETIPEQINAIFVDREQGEVSLLSSAQRDLFFERVMEATEDLDTALLVEEVFKEVACEQRCFIQNELICQPTDVY